MYVGVCLFRERFFKHGNDRLIAQISQPPHRGFTRCGIGRKQIEPVEDAPHQRNIVFFQRHGGHIVRKQCRPRTVQQGLIVEIDKSPLVRKAIYGALPAVQSTFFERLEERPDRRVAEFLQTL